MNSKPLSFRTFNAVLFSSFWLSLFALGCGNSPEKDASGNTANDAATTETDVVTTGAGESIQTPGSTSSKDPKPKDIVFKDHVRSNAKAPVDLDSLVFLDTDGRQVALADFLGKKNIVLVFTEGFSGGMLCPFCKTHTSRLVANYQKFKDLNTQVLVVYPGSRDHLDEFIEAAAKGDQTSVSNSVPFPLVLDEDLSAVKYFNIASNLAHPSTFIIDQRGKVRLSYVGSDMSADRPSVKAMLKIIKDANVSDQ